MQAMSNMSVFCKAYFHKIIKGVSYVMNYKIYSGHKILSCKNKYQTTTEIHKKMI